MLDLPIILARVLLIFSIFLIIGSYLGAFLFGAILVAIPLYQRLFSRSGSTDFTAFALFLLIGFITFVCEISTEFPSLDDMSVELPRHVKVLVLAWIEDLMVVALLGGTVRLLGFIFATIKKLRGEGEESSDQELGKVDGAGKKGDEELRKVDGDSKKGPVLPL